MNQSTTLYNKLIKGITNTIIAKAFVYLALPASLIILFVVIYDLGKSVENLSKDVISRTIDKVDIELDQMVSPVLADLNLVRELSIEYNMHNNTVEDYNSFMLPIISNNKAIKSGHYADLQGNSFMLLQKKDSLWFNRITRVMEPQTTSVKLLEWKQNNDLSLSLVKEWIDSSFLEKDPRNKDWFKKTILGPPLTDTWTDPYVFITTKDRGLSVSTWWHDSDKNKIVMSFDILLLDIVKYLNKIIISKEGHAVLFTNDDKIICQSNHIKFSCPDSAQKFIYSHYTKIGMPVFEAMSKEWEEHSHGLGEAFSFTYNGKTWWTEVSSYDNYGDDNMKVAVLVPESDFMEEMNNSLWIVIFGYAVIFLLSLISIRAYRKQHKINKIMNARNIEIARQRDEIGLQKEEIETQHTLVSKQRDEIQEVHQDISKSISYAQRIQSSVLPKIEVLNENTQDSFVLFMPRDVVSGDFYYLKKVENRLIIVASDCTGHGVPGAFMSMLGLSLLNNIIHNNCKMEADKILNRLRKHIIHSLGQSNEGQGQQDGMDMSVCILDLDTRELKYAGANNSIIIVSSKHQEWSNRKELRIMSDEDSKQTLYKIKADNMPVSIYLKMDDFKQKTFNLSEGDMVYLYSDGYIDQFGGATKKIRDLGGKKFKIKAFQRLLMEISQQSAKEQVHILEQTIVNWRGEIQQIDDITVIGFRV